MEERKEYYLKIKGKTVAVSEEVYRAYKSADRRERKQRQRIWRCRIPREKGRTVHMKRCTKNCKDCKYVEYGKRAGDSVLSMERLQEIGYDEPDPKQDVEKNYIADEEKAELYAAISGLTKRQQKLIELIYFDGKTEQEVAEYYGCSKSAISQSLNRIFMSLKKNLENN